VWIGYQHFPFQHFAMISRSMWLRRLCSHKRNVVIANDVWIGSGVTILSGVTIGSGAVVGAHSVVASRIEPYAIVAGNPAHLIRYRFDAQTRKKMLKLLVGLANRKN